jgi:hypothetical protein
MTAKSLIRFRAGLSILVCAAAVSAAAADGVKEPFAPARQKEKVFCGHTAVLYRHECLKEWGPDETGQQYFWVIQPKSQPKAGQSAARPLVVYLHSAGAGDEAASNEIPCCIRYVDAGGPEFLGLVPNSTTYCANGWWGYMSIKGDPAAYQQRLSTAERRVLATIEWVVQKYHIDRNRIYLCGISMGGSGTLGIGMCHGDIFAAALAGVPAGAGHVLHRMHFPPPPGPHAAAAERAEYLRAVSGVGLPDAPPILDFSSPADTWSEGQGQLLRAAHDGRHPIVFAWGPWGHINHYDVAHRAAYEFPWLRIRKDEAYPVFTDASSDQHYCGLAPPHPDAEGQINALFRWKNMEDTAARFSIELRLVGNFELTAPVKIPAESVVDVALRRLQHFKVRSGQRYAWTFGAGPQAQSGVAEADAAGLLVFPRLVVRGQPACLTVKQ